MISRMETKESPYARSRHNLRQIWQDNWFFLTIVGILITYHGVQAVISLLEPTIPIWATLD